MCPVCRTPMVAFEMDGVEVDRCVECGGTWLDAGEFISIAGLEDDSADSFSEALASARAVSRTRRRCPRCPRRLGEIEVGRDPAVVLESLPLGTRPLVRQGRNDRSGPVLRRRSASRRRGVSG